MVDERMHRAQQAQREREAQALVMRAQYGEGWTTEQADAIFEKAYELGHSEGWWSVDSWYEDLASLINLFKDK